jgi:hypothetical protein
MKTKVILLFFIYLLLTTSCGVDVEYDTSKDLITVPSEYYISSILIRCDSCQMDSVSYNIVLKDFKGGRSQIYLNKDYDNYYKEIKNLCRGDSGIIFVTFVSTSDTTLVDVSWKIYRRDTKRPIVKLRPYRI